MPNQSTQQQLDQLFLSLADPTRRAVLERLSAGPASVGELARPFPMALPSFTQHLGVLEQCGLVKSTKAGRVRTYQLVPKRLTAAEQWFEKQRRIWESRLNQLDSYLLEMKNKENDSTK